MLKNNINLTTVNPLRTIKVLRWSNSVQPECFELVGIDELNAGRQTVGERNDLGTCREGLTNWHLDKTELRSSRDGGGS